MDETKTVEDMSTQVDTVETATSAEVEKAVHPLVAFGRKWAAKVPDLPIGRKAIKRSRIIMSVLIAAIGAYCLYEGLRLGFMTTAIDGTAMPDLGLFPALVGGLLLVTCILMAISEARASLESQAEQDIDPRGYLRVINILVLSILYVLLFPRLGFTLTTLCYVLYGAFFMHSGPDHTKLWMKLLVPTAMVLGLRFGFNALGLMLPAAPIPFLARIGI